jgi:hypothetical protein
VTARGRKGNLRGGNRGSGWEKFIACAGLCAADDNIFTGDEPAWRKQPDSAIYDFDVLEHRDCISTVGNGRSGHDLAGRSRGQVWGRRFAGTN